MSIILISLIALLLVIVLVPQRIRFALNQTFAFLVIPFRDLSMVTGNYIFNYPNRSRRLLNSSGISESPYFGKAIGTIIITAVTLISIFADLELIILTLSGVLQVQKGMAITEFLALKPAECMAIALIGGVAMLGILFFDYFKQTLLPDNMIWGQKIRKIVMYISAIMLVLGLISMGLLAKYRSNAAELAISSNIEGIENKAAGSDTENSEVSYLKSAEQTFIRTYLFVYIALLTLVNGIMGFLALSPFFGLFICFLLALLLIPIGVIFFFSNMMDRLITLLFNISVAVFNVIQGVFNGLSNIMNRLLNIDDTVAEENFVQETNPNEIQRGFTTRQAQMDHNINQNQPQQEQQDRTENIDNQPYEDQSRQQAEEAVTNAGFNPLEEGR